MHPTSIAGVIPVHEMRGDDEQDTKLLQVAYAEARRFLLSQKWCFGIGEAYFGDGVGGIVAVFLMQIEPVPGGVDEWLWVVAGDVPSAYLVLDDCATPVQALKTYIVMMREWVTLANHNKCSRDVLPVNAASTPENAEILEKRLDCIDEIIVPHFGQRTIQ